MGKFKLPDCEGVYELLDDEYRRLGGQEIDVYDHPIKGICCYSEDFGSGGTGVDDETDCYVSVQFTGLPFGKRLRDL